MNFYRLCFLALAAPVFGAIELTAERRAQMMEAVGEITEAVAADKVFAVEVHGVQCDNEKNTCRFQFLLFPEKPTAVAASKVGEWRPLFEGHYVSCTLPRVRDISDLIQLKDGKKNRLTDGSYHRLTGCLADLASHLSL